MKSSSRDKHQLNLPAAEVQTLSQTAGVRKNISQPTPDSPDQADIDAALLYDATLKRARLSVKEVALTVGISESLVSRWRSPEHREQPSLGQLLRHPIGFHLALHRELNDKYGLGQHALRQLLDAAGALALAVGE